MGVLSSLEKLAAGTMLLGAVSLSSGCSSSPKSTLYVRKAHKFHNKELTEANKFLMSFPEQIPGANRIDKYMINDAKYCLVHIRQDHYQERLTTRDLRDVVKNQDNIYLILSYFIKHKGLESVYDEWYTQWDLDDNNMPIELKNIIQNMNKYDKNTELYKLTKQELDLRMDYTATERLAVEGKLKIKPSETLVGYYFKTMDEREDIALESLSNDGGTWFILPFGLSHTFGGTDSCGYEYMTKKRVSSKDNIAEWNKKYPDKKFSLIEIEPKGLKKCWKDK